MKASLTSLVIGQTLLVAFVKTEGNKAKLDIAEVLPNPSRNTALSALNADDERFSQNAVKARRAFNLTASPAMIEKYFGVSAKEIEAMKPGERMEVNILNPTIDGVRLRLQVRETHKPSPYQLENAADTAKCFVSKDGSKTYPTKGGQLIWSNVTATNGAVSHEIINSDFTGTWEEVQSFVPTQVEAKQSING